VQWMPAKPVRIGDELEITAKHDTYGVSFSFQDAAEQLNGMDPLWHSLHAQSKFQQSEIIKACTTNPLELRKEAIAARVAALEQTNTCTSDYLVKLMS